MNEKYTIGLDYGTLSGRGVLVRCSDGQVMATAVKEYKHGVMDHFLPDGITELPDAWCLEYPHDYLEVLEEVVPKIVQESGVKKEDIIGLGIDFTSCTVLPVDEHAKPLCEFPEYAANRNAYVKLWKHHGAQKQADRINALLEKLGLDQDPRFGGKVSPELMIPKVLELLEESPEVYHRAAEILEAGDWLTRVLTDSHKRSCSMAGYKAWWNAADGYAGKDFLKQLHPELENFVEEKAPGQVCALGEAIGYLNEKWAQKLGLSAGIAVAPTIIDSHAGVPGSGVSNDHQMMMVVGTSSVVVGLSEKPYSEMGVCGAVKDAIVPGYYALESGLASVGDLFGWFVTHCVPADYIQEAQEKGIDIHTLLCKKAQKLTPGQSGVMALDWWNGNKTPFVDGNLTGVLFGLTLHTRPEEIYRALIEATAFGTKRIVELYEKSGLNIEEIIASGGIAMKNKMLMQIYADVLGKPLKIAASDQAAALGSAVYAALSAGEKAGGYDSYWTAVRRMSRVKEEVYRPNQINMEKYEKLYSLYCKFGGIMGENSRELLWELREMKKD